MTGLDFRSGPAFVEALVFARFMLQSDYQSGGSHVRIMR